MLQAADMNNHVHPSSNNKNMKMLKHYGTNRQAGRQAERQADRQTDRQRLHSQQKDLEKKPHDSNHMKHFPTFSCMTKLLFCLIMQHQNIYSTNLAE